MKGIRAHVYKWDLGDCTNGGISSRCGQVTVVGIEGAESHEPTDEAPAVKLVTRTFGSKTIVHAEPVEPVSQGHVGWMAGGNFIATCDSRFSKATDFYGAVSLHDRSESHEQYRQLST